MTKSINSLKSDIYSVLEEGGPKPSLSQVQELSRTLTTLLTDRLLRKDTNALRLSRLGTPDRKLWFSINKPELGEKLDGATKLKFLYGEIIEQLVMFLAEVSGHDVVMKQSEVDIDGIKGHIDCIIDGVLFDVKSASSFAFRSFDPENKDPFGYTNQLSSYLSSLKEEELLQVKKEAFFLVVNKENGDIKLVKIKDKGIDYSKIVEQKKNVLDMTSPPEDKCYSDVPNDSKGNRVLSKDCGYCPFKKECWKDSNHGAGLIPIQYSNEVRYFTVLTKTPVVKGKTGEPF